MARFSHTSQRIVVVGGGVAGLSVAFRLAQSGLSVTLFEAAEIGSQATTRNQGWLHSGAWFAAQHPNLAKLCHESLKQTMQFCPDCVEPFCPPFAFVFSRPDSNIAAWKGALDQASIPYDEADLAEFVHAVPNLNRELVQHVYRLPDRAIRWDVLLEQLAAGATNAGAEIRTETTVDRLLRDNGAVHGVVTGTGEEVPARLVVLAANAGGTSLWPGSGEPRVGEQSSYTFVTLKSNLLALKPEVAGVPFCVVDADGFNHLPHLQTSLFGCDNWRIVPHAAAETSEPEETASLRRLFGRFFPGVDLAAHQVAEWAGTTVQAMHPSQITPGIAPLPTVIDYAAESPRSENLISVFTGRATLWTHVAEETRKLVLDKLQSRPIRASRPPWEATV
jgi:glycine/D-amino acid oxidase-like deaminating enzyme